jgi:hypothetical protein
VKCAITVDRGCTWSCRACKVAAGRGDAMRASGVFLITSVFRFRRVCIGTGESWAAHPPARGSSMIPSRRRESTRLPWAGPVQRISSGPCLKTETAYSASSNTKIIIQILLPKPTAGIAQLGERQTEDLKVACSIHAHRTYGFSPPIYGHCFQFS